VYDKLGVADRLELALFCLHNRILDNGPKPAEPVQPVPANGNSAVPAAGVPEKVS
jgi:hypothetical protein